MNETLLKLTENLIEELKIDPVYQALLLTHQRIEDDPQLQALISTFNKTKSIYDEAKRYGKHHPDLKEATASYQASKTALYNHPTIKEHKQLEITFQQKLDTISKSLAETVSSHIPYEERYKIHKKGGASCSSEKA